MTVRMRFWKFRDVPNVRTRKSNEISPIQTENMISFTQNKNKLNEREEKKKPSTTATSQMATHVIIALDCSAANQLPLWSCILLHCYIHHFGQMPQRRSILCFVCFFSLFFALIFCSSYIHFFTLTFYFTKNVLRVDAVCWFVSEKRVKWIVYGYMAWDSFSMLWIGWSFLLVVVVGVLVRFNSLLFSVWTWLIVHDVRTFGKKN